MNNLGKIPVGEALKNLLSISSDPICDVVPVLPKAVVDLAGARSGELLALLKAKNGFYAFESALHVLPAGCPTLPANLQTWNDIKLWRGLYGESTKEFVSFAEDIYACQFGILHENICKFEPETGEIERFATNLEEWAHKILDDYEYETGHPVARRWQELHGPLTPGTRLFPKIPFVLRGQYDVENLFALDAFEGLKYQAEIYQQIRDVPDGSTIRLRIIE